MINGSNGLVRLLEEHHNRVLSARSIEGVITSLQFERLWGESTEEQKVAAKKLIEANNKKSILAWMRKHPSIDIGEKPIRDLYPIAKRLGVRNYSRLLRHELIAAIQREESNCGSQ